MFPFFNVVAIIDLLFLLLVLATKLLVSSSPSLSVFRMLYVGVVIVNVYYGPSQVSFVGVNFVLIIVIVFKVVCVVAVFFACIHC